MPQILECIDAIARRIDRDVLFADIPEAIVGDLFEVDHRNYDPQYYKKCKTRADAIAFLDASGIAWKPCFRFFSTSGFISAPYTGTIFIDVPNDAADQAYRAVCDYFEHEDGSPRFEDFHLFVLPLTIANRKS